MNRAQIPRPRAQVFADVEDYRAGGPRQPRAALDSEALQARHAECLAHLLRAPVGLEAEVVQERHGLGVDYVSENVVPDCERRVVRPLFGGLFGQEDFLGVERRKHGKEVLRGVELGAIEFARADFKPRGEEVVGFVDVHREDVVAAAAVELRVLHHSPWGDYAGNRAFYELARHGRFVLVANRDFAVARENFRQILVDDMVRNPRHWVVLPLCERDSQQARAVNRVVVEHFVEVAESEEQERVFGERIFHTPVLLEHRRRFFGFCHFFTKYA